MSTRVVVLGVGNVLCCDDGAGVRVVERLRERYRFPDDVALVDGGCLGLGLLSLYDGAEALIVVDVVRNGGAPGTLYRLTASELPLASHRRATMHEVSLLDALRLSRLTGSEPRDVVIVGVEPGDLSSPSLELTPAVRERVPELVAMVVAELRRLAVTPIPTAAS